MTWRAIKPDEWATLQEIALATYRDHYTYLWADRGAHYMTTVYGKETLQTDLTNPDLEHYFLVDAETIVGFLKLNCNAVLESAPADDAMELERVYLRRQTIGRGFGSRVLTLVEQKARSLCKKVVWLKVMDSSPAVRFYKKNGYRETGETSLELPGLHSHLRRQLILAKSI